MKRIISALLFPILIQGTICANEKPNPKNVWDIAQKAALWQIETFDSHHKYRALSIPVKRHLQQNGKPPQPYIDTTWHMGAFYVGLNEWRKVSNDAQIESFLLQIGERNEWKLCENFKPEPRPYHADDHTVGQLYLALYEEKRDSKMLNPTQERFDWILENPRTGSLKWRNDGSDSDAHKRWGWCDALFMAPPVWVRLAKITGEDKYLQFMDQEYQATHELLWSEKDRFFWRDSSFIGKKETNGENFFWARGNGWVFGGLALMIPHFPEHWERKEFYIHLYQEMAAAIKDCQRKDGTWSMGILGGSEGYPVIETSGTSFFTFGLAWGINNGLLDPKVYEPVVLNAWNALSKCITREGYIGYVQPVGAKPGDAYADKTEVYGMGAFLAACAEVYKWMSSQEDYVKQN